MSFIAFWYPNDPDAPEHLIDWHRFHLCKLISPLNPNLNPNPLYLSPSTEDSLGDNDENITFSMLIISRFARRTCLALTDSPDVRGLWMKQEINLFSDAQQALQYLSDSDILQK